jgi:hypothetical protein
MAKVGSGSGSGGGSHHASDPEFTPARFAEMRSIPAKYIGSERINKAKTDVFQNIELFSKLRKAYSKRDTSSLRLGESPLP